MYHESKYIANSEAHDENDQGSVLGSFPEKRDIKWEIYWELVEWDGPDYH